MNDYTKQLNHLKWSQETGIMVPLLRRDRISQGYPELMFEHNSRPVQVEGNLKIETAIWQLRPGENLRLASGHTHEGKKVGCRVSFPVPQARSSAWP